MPLSEQYHNPQPNLQLYYLSVGSLFLFVYVAFLDPKYVLSFLPLFPFYLEIVAFELILEQSVNCETVYTQTSFAIYFRS